MTAKIIDGREVAASIRQDCRARVAALKAAFEVTRGLAVILVGQDAASAVYVRNRIKGCADVGIRSLKFDYSSDVAPQAVIDKIKALNVDPAVHGILVQLPLPPQF